MSSLLKTSRYLCSIAYSRACVSSRICKRIILPYAFNASRNTRALQTSCRSFNEAVSTYAETPLESETTVPAVEPAKNPSGKLLQDLYRLDADVQRLGRLQKAEVEKVFTSMKIAGRVSSSQGLLLIRCCGSFMPEVQAELRTELVNDIWNTLPLLECNLDASHYNALLKVYLENEHSFNPAEFLATMERQRVEPNRVTYQRLLAQFCQNGDIDGASRILEFVKSKDIPLNEAIFNELITGHAKAKNMDDAKKTLEVMRNAQLSLNSTTYTALACGYALSGDIENVLETIKDAESDGNSLRDKEILNIIFTLTVNGHGHLVEQIIPKIHYASGYNQKCTNTILELVNRGYHEVAFKLLNTAPTGLMEDNTAALKGMYFIKQIVKEGLPSYVVIEYCRKLKETGSNKFGLLKATEAAFTFQRSDDAICYLKELHSQEQELCPHFFWPVLIHKKGVDKDMYDVLKLMMDLGCPANFDTFIDYFFPYVNTSDPVAVINKLKDIGYEVNDVVAPLCMHMLLRKEIKTAAELFKTFPVKVNPALVASRCLASAYMKSKDTSSTLEILQHCKENTKDYSMRVVDTDVYGKFLVDLVSERNFELPALEIILKEMSEKGMKLSRWSVNAICKHLGSRSSLKLTNLLESMVSKDESVQNGSDLHPMNGLSVDVSVEALEADLIMKKSKNLRTVEVLHKLLILHAKLKNLKRVQELVEELEQTDFVFRANSYAVLLELYCEHGDLDRAMHYKRLLDTEFPEFIVDDHKIINLAQLLVVNKKYDDAENLIKKHHSKFGVQGNNKYLFGNIFRLLDAFANSEEVGHARKVFEMLHSFGYCKAGNVLLGPLVKAYLLRNDLQGAMEEYLRIVETYKVTPWKTELLKHLINLQDSANLQTIIDASITAHGEANVLFELAEAFIDCGQLQQARKVMETPGLKAKMEKIENICERFMANNKIVELEAFVQVTKDIFGMDKNRLYYQLLRAYVNAEDVDRALGIWVTMQEENVVTTNRTLYLLGTFLQSKNQPVPFEVPATSHDPIDRYEALKKKTRRNLKEVPEEQISKGIHFLKSLESHVWRHSEDFPIKSLFFFLKDNPELITRVTKMADMYYQEGLAKPRNALWNYFMTEKRFDEADKILQTTPELKKNLLFRDIVDQLRGSNDIEISRKLVDIVSDSDMARRTKGIAFSSHINVLVSNRKLNEALEALEEAERSVDVWYLNKGTLNRLKVHLASANMTIPSSISEIGTDRRSLSSTATGGS